MVTVRISYKPLWTVEVFIAQYWIRIGLPGRKAWSETQAGATPVPCPHGYRKIFFKQLFFLHNSAFFPTGATETTHQKGLLREWYHNIHTTQGEAIYWVLETLLAQNLDKNSLGLQIRNPYAGHTVHPQLWTFHSLTYFWPSNGFSTW